MANSSMISLILVIITINLFTSSINCANLLRKRSSHPDDRIYFEDAEIVTRFRIGQTTRKENPQHKCSSPSQRYHKGSGQCYDTGKPGGPCGKNMIFYEDTDNKIYGDCDCKIKPDEPPYVYDVPSTQCYRSYHQAYCPSDKQWLVFDEESHPVCETRKCPTHPTDEKKTIVYFKGKCVLLNASKPDLCTEDSKKTHVGFTPGDVKVHCISDPNFTDLSVGVRQIRDCPPGSKKDIVGKCRVVKNVNTDSRPITSTLPPSTTPPMASSTRRTRPTRRPRPTVDSISFIDN